MNIERLEHLLYVMQVVALRDREQDHNHFNWGSWFRSEDEDAVVKLARQKKVFVELPWSCGTTACVLGHGAFDPVFRAQGLTIGCAPGMPFVTVVLRDAEGRVVATEEDAGCRFFDLTVEQVLFLFYGSSLLPADVAVLRLQYLLETKDWSPDHFSFKEWRRRVENDAFRKKHRVSLGDQS